MDLTVKDAARLLNTSETRVYRWIHDGSLPCHRVSDKYRLNRVELLEWATARRLKVSPEIFAAQKEPPARQLLTESLRRGGVVHDLAGADEPSVLQALCQRLQLPASVDRQELYKMLLAREELSSTAIGHGVAIPHPRGPIVLGVSDPTVTLAFLQQPIDFGALDGRPVSILFAIISINVRGHLQLLSHLMFALQDEPFLALLARKAQAAEILAQAQRLESAMHVRPPHDTSA
jgi:nitrogen PTS system EIIA component